VADRRTTPPATETTPTSTAAERAAARRAAARRLAVKRAQARRKARKEREAREARAARRERERQRRERAQTTTTPPATSAPAADPDPPAATTTAKPKPPAGPTVHHVVETASLKLVTKKGISFVQQGSVTGTVSGSMRLDAKLGGKGVEGTFVVTLANGTLTGQASAGLTLDGSVARFRGTAAIAKGTGAYAALMPAQLAFSGTVASDASTSTVKLAGDLRY
jgi:hypothetical protein